MQDQTYFISRSDKKRVRFVLTPLIDVIFLLLIFFMLSTHIAPYSLMDFSSQRYSEQETKRPDSLPSEDKDAENDNPLLLRLLHGHVRLGQESYPVDNLSVLMDELTGKDIQSVQILLARSVEMQDMVRLLEELKASGMGHVSVLQRAE